MEIGALVLLAFLVAYLWARGREKQQQERRELRWSFHVERFGDVDDLTTHWHFDLVEMTARESSMGYPPHDAQYGVRRDERGVWRIRLTPECWRKQVDELMADKKLGFPSEETINERLDRLGRKGPRWRKLHDDVAAPLESQYQRFLLHYRES